MCRYRSLLIGRTGILTRMKPGGAEQHRVTSHDLEDRPSPPARSGLTTSIVVLAFVLVGIGTVQFVIGGVGNLIAGPDWQERALGILFLGLAAMGVYALRGWFEGRQKSRWVALALLPIMSLALLWDDQRYGDTTRAEWVGILVPPLAVWVLLWLPSVRRVFRQP